MLLPVRQYRYKYYNGQRLVFFNNAYISIYSHNYYTKHRKYRKHKKRVKSNKYRRVEKQDYRYNNSKYR